MCTSTFNSRSSDGFFWGDTVVKFVRGQVGMPDIINLLNSKSVTVISTSLLLLMCAIARAHAATFADVFMRAYNRMCKTKSSKKK